MTKTFTQSFEDVFRLAKSDIKPLGAKLGKLFEEGGELAECVNIHQGYITHKEMKEPLVGEVADVVQCALAILVDAHPEVPPGELMELFLSHFERKNAKWEGVQRGDPGRIARALDAEEAPGHDLDEAAECAVPETPPGDIDRRVVEIVSEQLGYSRSEVGDNDRFVEDLGADSLDLVELVMAIEDDFGMEISDNDAERMETVSQAIAYVKKRYGLGASEEALAEEDMSDFEQTGGPQHFDPAADYTERTGRHLSLNERMQERSRFNNQE